MFLDNAFVEATLRRDPAMIRAHLHSLIIELKPQRFTA
jgi:hypothetical protein